MQNERSIFSGDRVVNRYQHFSSTLQQGLRFVLAENPTKHHPQALTFTHIQTVHTHTLTE